MAGFNPGDKVSFEMPGDTKYSGTVDHVEGEDVFIELDKLTKTQDFTVVMHSSRLAHGGINA